VNAVASYVAPASERTLATGSYLFGAAELALGQNRQTGQEDRVAALDQPPAERQSPEKRPRRRDAERRRLRRDPGMQKGQEPAVEHQAAARAVQVTDQADRALRLLAGLDRGDEVSAGTSGHRARQGPLDESVLG